MKIFLVIDKIIQTIRKAIKFIMADYHCLLIAVVSCFIFLLEGSIHCKFIRVFLLLTIKVFGIFPSLFYFIDHFISIFGVLISIFKSNSELLAKSYLDLTKMKSKNYDFIYYDKTIIEEDVNFYEICINELIDIFPGIINYRFNILIIDKDKNTLDESRKMVGIYDSLNLKIFDYHPALIGLYSPAGATIMCKCINREYMDDLLKNHNSEEFNSESLKYINDICSLRKHILYHEFAHMISASINPDFFLTEEFQEAFNTEKHLIFPDQDSYFLNDFNEFIAEIIADYLESLTSKYNNINYIDTKVYNMVKCYIESISLTLEQGVTS